MTQAPTTAPAPDVSVEIATGLESIRLHGDRDEELYLSADGNFFEESFMTSRIVTAEENVKFIKKIEALVRGSSEYKCYIGYLRNDLGMNRCSFMSGIDMSNDDITLEMHHAPLTLFQIVEIIIGHRLNRGQAVTSLSIADEVMNMHFENKVGMVPLTKSAHKLVHARSLTIHPAMVHGNYLGFLRDYPDGVDETVISQIIDFVQISESDVYENSLKIDGSSATPILRADVNIPTRDQINLLLSVPAA